MASTTHNLINDSGSKGEAPLHYEKHPNLKAKTLFSSHLNDIIKYLALLNECTPQLSANIVGLFLFIIYLALLVIHYF